VLTILVIGGLILSGSGVLMVTIDALRTHFAWGVGCLFFPPLVIPYMLSRPQKSIKPLLLILTGIALIISASFLSMTYGPP